MNNSPIVVRYTLRGFTEYKAFDTEAEALKYVATDIPVFCVWYMFKGTQQIATGMREPGK